jgi:hypothetical protein
MKTLKFVSGVVMACGLAFVSSQSRAEIVLDFSSLSGAAVNFNGDGTFSFTPADGNQFTITDSKGVGESIDDTGYITGTFRVSDITPPNSTIQTAKVTGTGSLYIDDRDGGKLTATLTWNSIIRAGAGDILNFDEGINLTSIQYSGSESDYLPFVNAGSGVGVVSFQFSSGANKSLEYLSTHTASASFSGTLTAVPEPSTIVAGAGALGLLLVGVGAGSRKSRVLRIGK